MLYEASSDQKDTFLVEQIEKTNDIAIEGTEGGGGLLSPSHRMLAERKLVRILDIRLLPTIFLIFILNYIDVSFWDL